MKTLPKLSEYVTSINNTIPKNLDLINNYRLIILYNNFITQPPNISHFVPAKFENGVWIVLEEPNILNYDMDKTPINNKYFDNLQEYQTSLENCIFKGFVLLKNNNDFIKLFNKGIIITFYKEEKDLFITIPYECQKGLDTIEDLIPYNLEVTETIIKKFNL